MDINLTLISQAATFAIFIWFTVKFVWPYLRTAIDTRQKTIAEGLAAAERGKLDLELASRRSADVLRETKDKSADLLAQAERRGQQIIEEAKAAARVEADKVVAAAKAEIDQEAERAKQSLRERVAGLAVAGAEKILRREINAGAHADMLTALKQEL
ncbi:MAG: F0F1 ATP synthase subunit B [Zoogloeaceae bacterium]|jgi:F-type H+-transporting ATPase subunit b|nr:F0F1 ATP synthase subunit B [Zoogloeaceae bacterium]